MEINGISSVVLAALENDIKQIKHQPVFSETVPLLRWIIHQPCCGQFTLRLCFVTKEIVPAEDPDPDLAV